MTNQNKISACIMVKNEEQNLPELLKSLEGVVDEIVAIDHESTDKTRSILEKAGARILDLEDHAKYKRIGDNEKNILISYATGEWILNIDADERLNEDTKAELVKLAKQKDYDVIWLFSRHFYAPGKWFRYGFYVPHREPRFYRRSCKTDWNVRIHEAPKIEGKHFYSDVSYDHLYYTASEERIKSKHELYLDVELQHKRPYLSKNRFVKWVFILLGYPVYFLYGFFFRLAFLDGWIGITTNHFLSKYFSHGRYLELHIKKRLGLIKYNPIQD